VRFCNTEGCERPHYAKGLCQNCYTKKRFKERYHSDESFRQRQAEYDRRKNLKKQVMYDSMTQKEQEEECLRFARDFLKHLDQGGK